MIEYNSISQRWKWLQEKYPLCNNFESPRSWEEPWVLHRLEELPVQEQRFLDCGCGRGTFAGYVKDHFPHFDVHACDLFDSGSREGGSPQELADRLMQRGVLYHEEDLRSLSFGEKSFDIITCVSVLEHITESQKALDEMIRVLAPGGALIVTVDIMLEEGWDVNRTLAELGLALRRGDVCLKIPSDIPDPVSLGRNADVWRVSPQTWYFEWTPKIWKGKPYRWRWHSSVGYVLVKK